MKLGKALDSVRFADDIVVVDDNSTNGTVGIAAQYTNKIFTRALDDFSTQKNFGIEQAVNPWVLVLDADEAVSPELREEIISILSTTPDTAYSLRRNHIFMGREIRYSGVQNDRVVRLFPREVRFGTMRVHEVPETGNLPVRELQGTLYHDTYRNYEEMFRKVDLYSTLKARDLSEKGYRVTLGKLFFKPGFRFFRHYVLQLGFLDGRRGYIIAWLRALEIFQRLTKTWRIQEGES